MATKAKPRPKKEKVKQGYLPGTEPYSNPAIDKAAEALVDTRANIATLKTNEDDQASKLLGLMVANEVKVYSYDGKIIRIKDLQKLVIKKKPKEKNIDLDGE